jgi:hypothetical protein
LASARDLTSTQVRTAKADAVERFVVDRILPLADALDTALECMPESR